jgi:hypothetical protein
MSVSIAYKADEKFDLSDGAVGVVCNPCAVT